MFRVIISICFSLMSEKRAWSEKEDSLLMDMHEENAVKPETERLKWNQIAQRISSECKIVRTGKQCRERWHNQLDPSILKDRIWTEEEERILFAEQEAQGNKWSLIAEKLMGRTDNNLKNYFYSTLRKSMRKVNHYLSEHKKEHPLKNIKPIKQQILNKIIAVADKRYDNIKVLNRSEDGSRPEGLAEQLKKLLINVHFQAKDNTKDQSEMLETIIIKIQEFNKSYKKKKARKNVIEDSGNEDIQLHSEKCNDKRQRNKHKKRLTPIKKKSVNKQQKDADIPLKKETICQPKGRIDEKGHSETVNFENIPRQQKHFCDNRALLHRQSSSSNQHMSSSSSGPYSLMDSRRISSMENSISRQYQKIVSPVERYNYEQPRTDFFKGIPEAKLQTKFSADLPIEEDFEDMMGDVNQIMDKSQPYEGLNGVTLKKGLSINSTVQEDESLFPKRELQRILRKRSSIFCGGNDDSLK